LEFDEIFFSSYIDQQSNLGSSRRFGTSSDLKLQKLLRQHETRIDASTIGSPTVGDRSTRFDYETKRKVCFLLNNHFHQMIYSIFRVEQIVGKKQLNI
jgi:hypothetical protein